MKPILRVYYRKANWVVFVAISCGAALCLSGCGAAFELTEPNRVVYAQQILQSINAERKKAGVEPLEIDDKLSQGARKRAVQSASANSTIPDEASLKRLVQAGNFARFSLSLEVKGEDLEAITRDLRTNPISRGKLTHPSLSHVGVGFAERLASLFVVMDFAKLVDTIEFPNARKTVIERIGERRQGNSVEVLAQDKKLDEMAQQAADEYMSTNKSGEVLIAETQRDLNQATFVLGRVLVTFQVAADLASVVIPERVSDPALAYAGLGLAQGNHKAHEPGALAVVLLLAEPQTAHQVKRTRPTVPPAKSIDTAPGQVKESIVDQAWVATLAGNHLRASELFEKAYQQTKKGKLLYEAARARARNEQFDKALNLMRRYAQIAKGKEREKADKLVGKLEKGETIFSKSQKHKMSVEARRFFLIGQRLFTQQEWDGAIDAFQQAYSYSPHPDIIYNIGLTHCRAGRIGAALDFFGEYQRFVPQAESVDQAKQLFAIGMELYNLGQFEAASRHFTMAYGQLPTGELLYNLALCHKGMGNKKEAIRLLREFLDTDPHHRDRADAKKMIKELSR